MAGRWATACQSAPSKAAMRAEPALREQKSPPDHIWPLMFAKKRGEPSVPRRGRGPDAPILATRCGAELNPVWLGAYPSPWTKRPPRRRSAPRAVKVLTRSGVRLPPCHCDEEEVARYSLVNPAKSPPI